MSKPTSIPEKTTLPKPAKMPAPGNQDQDTPTRQKLIDLIVDTYFSRGGSLQVAKIASEAGISRQAFHRYYGDLIAYIKGEKDVNALLPKSAPDSVSGLLQVTQERASELEQRLAVVEKAHQAELKTALDRHITSLMNNDITLFETDSVRVTLDKQTTYISHLTAQLDQLKAELTKAKLNATNQRLVGTPGSRIIYEPNLKPAFTAYKKDGDYKAYLSEKSKEISKIIEKVNQHESQSTSLIIFVDRFISNFEDFIAYLPAPRKTEIVMRLPVFSSMEIKNLLRKINRKSIFIYVPECPSVAETAAQRKFRAGNIPSEELLSAEKADHVHLPKGVEQVVHFTATSQVN
ncbi:TetR/AcrR family transcriptional regulator [Pseudomonas guariconensis]|uniref:TetR/AcrR family transcriptional regulator n=1 Tax=Pseudomonas guariconensis TaxID=1288410 RepID=UPI0018ABC47F|nr:TetR/AcrR family transcriptional regulator [Pseudomonas guariconensis]MBF8742124.1 TetR/AcrR family transcriptional regulator [Pseudomonas guariconensis]MBF8751120.1 TetR/AcrR family transcriptional regulator [Pseudomonas guariconensis]